MEIKPQELRLNNLVLEAGAEARIYQLEHRYKDNYMVNDLKLSVEEFQKRFKGIDLTPEWLEKFGAIRTPRINKETLAIIIDSETAIEYRLEPWVLKRISLTIAQEDTEMIINRIEKSIDLSYVHQLQNLYFAITGKELAIDNKSL